MLEPRQFLPLVSAALVIVVSAAVFAAPKDDKTTTDDWYLWSLKGQPAGYFHAVRKASGDKAAPVLLVHEFVLNWRGKRMSLKMQTLCRDDDCFTPVKIVSEGEGDDEFQSFVATIRWTRDPDAPGKLTTTVNGRRVEIELPRRTVTWFALFEIVRRLPFDGEKVFEFHSLEAEELNLKRDHKLTYVGTEELEISGKKTMLHKFEHTGRGSKPAQYWVNEDRQLVRVLVDGRKEFLLTTQEQAKAGVK